MSIMTWTEQQLRTIVLLSEASIGLLMLTSFFLMLIGIGGPWLLFAIGFLGLVLCSLYVYKSFKMVEQEDRVPVEVFGAYLKTFGPGLHFFPLFVVKGRYFVKALTQRYPLFEERISIDFQDGSASPKGAMAFVRMMNEEENRRYQLDIRDRVQEEKHLQDYIGRDPAYRMSYLVRNVKDAVVSLIENATRSYLNTLSIREAIHAGEAGYNIFPKLLNNEEITKTLANWGLVVEKVVVADFDLSETIIKDREAVHKAMQEERAMSFSLKKRKKEISLFVKALSQATGKSLTEIKRAINDDPELKKSFASFVQDMISRYASIDAKVLTDIRTDGGGSSLGETILQAITAWKKIH